VLETGERIERRGDEPFPTASLIKVPILVALFDEVEKGNISLDDRVRVLKVDKVPGSGMLQHFHDGLEVTIGDLAMLMITISDNTATNMLLDRVPMRRVWEKMEALGLPRTKVHSKSFLRITSVSPDSSAKYGLGVTTLWGLQQQVVACVLTKENKDTRWIIDNEPQLLMAEMGRRIVEAFR